MDRYLWLVLREFWASVIRFGLRDFQVLLVYLLGGLATFNIVRGSEEVSAFSDLLVGGAGGLGAFVLYTAAKSLVVAPYRIYVRQRAQMSQLQAAIPEVKPKHDWDLDQTVSYFQTHFAGRGFGDVSQASVLVILRQAATDRDTTVWCRRHVYGGIELLDVGSLDGVEPDVFVEHRFSYNKHLGGWVVEHPLGHGHDGVLFRDPHFASDEIMRLADRVAC